MKDLQAELDLFESDGQTVHGANLHADAAAMAAGKWEQLAQAERDATEAAISAVNLEADAKVQQIVERTAAAVSTKYENVLRKLQARLEAESVQRQQLEEMVADTRDELNRHKADAAALAATGSTGGSLGHAFFGAAAAAAAGGGGALGVAVASSAAADADDTRELARERERYAQARATLQSLWEELEVPEVEIAEFLWKTTELLPASSACLRLYQQEEQRLQHA